MLLLYIANAAVAVDNQAETVFRTGGTLEIGFMDIARTMVGSVIHLYSEKSRKGYIKGKNPAAVESGKWTGPVKSPFSVEIVAVIES